MVSFKHSARAGEHLTLPGQGALVTSSGRLYVFYFNLIFFLLRRGGGGRAPLWGGGGVVFPLPLGHMPEINTAEEYT